MRFLANENVASATVDALRSRGGDVVWVKEQMRGAGDDEILERSRREERVLLTFDKDFGELAFRAGLPATCGIVLLRLRMPKSIADAVAIADRVSARDDWKGWFSVVEPGRIRRRDLPGN
jgi:predicted nuclease of predicted toxin-antitoxin system